MTPLIYIVTKGLIMFNFYYKKSRGRHYCLIGFFEIFTSVSCSANKKWSTFSVQFYNLMTSYHKNYPSIYPHLILTKELCHTRIDPARDLTTTAILNAMDMVLYL